MSDLIKQMGRLGDSRHPGSSHVSDLLSTGYPVTRIDQDMLLEVGIEGFIDTLMVDDDIQPVLIGGVSRYFSHHSICGSDHRGSLYIVDSDSVMELFPAGVLIHGISELLQNLTIRRPYRGNAPEVIGMLQKNFIQLTEVFLIGLAFNVHTVDRRKYLFRGK